jgi:hypothetical protein
MINCGGVFSKRDFAKFQRSSNKNRFSKNNVVATFPVTVEIPGIPTSRFPQLTRAPRHADIGRIYIAKDIYIPYPIQKSRKRIFLSPFF